MLWFSLSFSSLLPSLTPLSLPLLPSLFPSLSYSQSKRMTYFTLRKNQEENSFAWLISSPHRGALQTPWNFLWPHLHFPELALESTLILFQHHLVLLYDDTIHFPSFHFYLCYSCPKFFSICSTLSILHLNISSKYQALLCEIISNLPYLRPILCHSKASIIPILDTDYILNYSHLFTYSSSLPLHYRVLGRGRVELHYLFSKCGIHGIKFTVFNIF